MPIGCAIFTCRLSVENRIGRHFPALPQGTTNNLMDYSHAHALLKPQWDLIHNPETTTGLFDGMEEGASVQEITIITGQNSGIAPNGKVISVVNPVNSNYSIALGVSKSSYYVRGFTVFNEVNKQVETYMWDTSKGTYFNGNLTIEESETVELTYNVANDPVQTRIYRVRGDGCFYEYADVSHLSGSKNIQSEGANWKMSLLHNPSDRCQEEYERKRCEYLIKRHEQLLESQILRNAILNNPCLLEGPMLHFSDIHFQSEWMQEFNRVFSLPLYVAFFPAAVEVLLPIIVEHMGAEAGRRFLRGALIELLGNVFANEMIGLKSINGKILA